MFENHVGEIKLNSKLSYRVENGILICFVTGERSSDETLEHWQELINKCHYEDISMLLMTMALRGKFSPFEAIENYQAIIEMLKPTDLKVALVDLNHLSAPDSQVACNMGVSQGLNTAYFDSERKAKAWLLDEKDDLNQVNLEKTA